MLDVGDRGGGGLAGNQADGQRPPVEVIYFFSGPADDEGGRFNSVLIESLAQTPDLRRRKIVRKHLARGKAEIVDLAHGYGRIFSYPDYQAYAQLLPHVVGRHILGCL